MRDPNFGNQCISLEESVQLLNFLKTPPIAVLPTPLVLSFSSFITDPFVILFSNSSSEKQQHLAHSHISRSNLPATQLFTRLNAFLPMDVNNGMLVYAAGNLEIATSRLAKPSFCLSRPPQPLAAATRSSSPGLIQLLGGRRDVPRPVADGKQLLTEEEGMS